MKDKFSRYISIIHTNLRSYITFKEITRRSFIVQIISWNYILVFLCQHPARRSVQSASDISMVVPAPFRYARWFSHFPSGKHRRDVVVEFLCSRGQLRNVSAGCFVVRSVLSYYAHCWRLHRSRWLVRTRE